MKNVFGTQDNLKLYHKNGEVAYWFCKILNCYFREVTYDNQGNETSYSYTNSRGVSWKITYDEQGNETSYKDSRDESWTKTYDDKNRVTSYKHSFGVNWKRIYKENGTYEQINL